MATRHETQRWLEEGKRGGATHVIVALDSFSADEYPIQVLPNEDLHAKIARFNKNLHKVLEVYDLSQPLEPQLNGLAVWKAIPGSDPSPGT